MENRSDYISFVVLTILFTIWTNNPTETQAALGPRHDKVVVCYVAAWANYRNEKGQFGLPHLRSEHCTHLVYAFAGLNASTSSIRSHDPYLDLEENWGKGAYKKMTGLKRSQSGLKVSIAIGGWNEGSANYSELAASPERRRIFVSSVVEFVRKYDFDGLDLDWEFPAKRGGAPYDKQNFVLLVKELSEAFKGKGLLLTAAIGAGRDTIDAAYDLRQLSRYLDYIHVMAYDYHGSWDRRVLANAPLNRTMDKLSVEDTIRYLLDLGAPANKLVLGLPMYGRTFVLTKPLDSQQDNPFGAEALDRGFQGPFTKEDGFMGYNEICSALMDKSQGWKRGWDAASGTPYAVNDDKAIAYDDPKSFALKIDFVNKMQLAGAMVWSIDTDDFNGDCANLTSEYLDNSKGAAFPLMRTINMALSRVIDDHETNSIEPQSTGSGIHVDGSLLCYTLLPFLSFVVRSVWKF